MLDFAHSNRVKGSVMFLIRIVFWLSVVILLLPAEDTSSNAQASAQTDTYLNASRFIDAARTTASDIAGLCERSPQVCDTGEAAFDTFLRKARYGAKLVFELISGPQDSPAAPAMDWQGGKTARAATIAPVGYYTMAPPSQNTLQPADLVPDWSGPTPDKSV